MVGLRSAGSFGEASGALGAFGFGLARPGLFKGIMVLICPQLGHLERDVQDQRQSV